jgi:putative PEP-CTERM system TPR-repeat lipoprotein
LKSRLAKAYVNRKENAKAEVILEGLVSSHPDELKYRFSLASFYTLTDQPAKAERVLREAIAADPKDVQRYLLLSNFLEKQYGKEKAVAELERAVEAKPGLTQLKFLLVNLLLKSEQLDRAKTILGQVIDEQGVDPDGLKARVTLAGLYLQDGKNEEARSLIDEVLDINPGDVQSHFLRGQYYLRIKKYPEAISDFRMVLKDNPDSGEALTFLASAYYLNGENELALESLLKVTELLPNDIGTRLRVAEIYTRMNRLDDALEHIDYALMLDPESVSILRARAEVLAAQGLTDELEETLTRLEVVAPDTGLGALGKGRLYRRQNKFDESLAEFEKALEQEPDSVLLLTELVKTQVAMGDADSAIKRVKGVIENDPDNNAAHVLLGILYASVKDFASAEAEFMRQIKINPKSNVLYVQTARMRFQQGDADGAIQVLQEGLEELPFDQRLIQTLVAIYIQQGDLESAADLYQKAVSYAPDNVAFTIGYAEIMQQQEKVDAAIFAYERFLEKTPDNIIVTNNLAALLANHRTDSQSLQKAKELASRLLETNQPALLDTLAWVHYRLGEYNEAITVLTDVVDAEPDVPVFNYHLGMAYYKQGNQESAREYLSKAVAEEYTYAGIEEARETLAKLK